MDLTVSGSASSSKQMQKIEYGDYQTPLELAEQVCDLIARRGFRPAAILEPSCGTGSFLIAAMRKFPFARKLIGLDINPRYLEKAGHDCADEPFSGELLLMEANFFDVNRMDLPASIPDPLLIIGNPPWVTSAVMGSIGGSNLPPKSNIHGFRGIDAITGKGNFDVSEWMLLNYLNWLEDRSGVLAVLCKVSVARKVVLHMWEKRGWTFDARIYNVSALKYFGAVVQACLFVLDTTRNTGLHECAVHDDLSGRKPSRFFGFRNKSLVSDMKGYNKWKHLDGPQQRRWRSGIKHNCREVMEFVKKDGVYCNGLGECVELESEYLYPLMKGTEIALGKSHQERWMLVPQRVVGEKTASIEEKAPAVWDYLKRHEERLSKRSASGLNKHIPFSIFGVGDYSFATWKIAISGFHKKLDFRLVGPIQGKPTVLDDSTYFIACGNRAEAEFIHFLLNSDPARSFLSSLIFWDAKRPVTAAILNRLNMRALADEIAGRKRCE